MPSSKRAARPKRTSAARSVDLNYARKVLDAEARAVDALRRRVDRRFARAAQWILGLGKRERGRVVGTGMGKAGIVAQKVCATLASTGTPALFLHPVEALHGDLGMVTAKDIVLAFSNSGESEETVRLLPAVRRIGARIVAITGHPDSALGRGADLVLDLGKIEEPCPLRLAPSASTTAMLAYGDALALCVLKARGLGVRDYARLHPGGALGRKVVGVKEIMRTGSRCVIAKSQTRLKAIVERMTRARCGAAIVADGRGRLAGIFTDGDFRRVALQAPERLNGTLREHMTRPCKFIYDDMLVMDAQELMARARINALPVVDRKKKVKGLLDIQDIVGSS